MTKYSNKYYAIATLHKVSINCFDGRFKTIDEAINGAREITQRQKIRYKNPERDFMIIEVEWYNLLDDDGKLIESATIERRIKEIHIDD